MSRRNTRAWFLVGCAGLLGLLACSGAGDSRISAADAGASPVEEAPFDPTVERKPLASKSLTLATEWHAPSPTRSRPAQLKARVQPSHDYGVPTGIVSEHPTDREFTAVTFFPEPLRARPGTSSVPETDALAQAL